MKLKEIIKNRKQEIYSKQQSVKLVKKEIEQFKEQINELHEKRTILSRQRTSLRNQNALIPYTRHKFNFITKILFRRQYKNSLEMERISKEIKELSNEIINIDNEIKKIDEQIKQKNKIVFNSEKELWEKELILLDKENVVIDYLLRVYPDLAKDSEFMEDAIQRDEKYIEYDESNEIELYIPLLDKEIEYLGEIKVGKEDVYERQQEGVKKIKEELISPSRVEEGKYKVPKEFLLDSIRKSHIRTDRHGIGLLGSDFLEVDGKIDYEKGKMFEKLYSNKDYILGIHCSDYAKSQAQIDEILKNGLKFMRNEAKYTVAFIPDKNKRIDLPEDIRGLVGLINYNYKGAKTNFIFKFPKDVFEKGKMVPIWGYDDKEGSPYILPEYIDSYFIKGEHKIYQNDHQNEHQYKYKCTDMQVGSEFVEEKDCEREEIKQEEKWKS